MSEIPMQRPSGGCENCGGPVRTRKPEGWVCAKCVALLRGQAATAEEHREVLARTAARLGVAEADLTWHDRTGQCCGHEITEHVWRGPERFDHCDGHDYTGRCECGGWLGRL